MGMQQPFDFDTSWNLSAEILDETFPLAEGSHRDALDYLVHFEHLLVILADGTCTGLARGGQFLEAGGDPEAPSSILLEERGLRMEIVPCNRASRAAGRCREHRLRRLSALAAA